MCALVVENGSKPLGANAYADVATASDYLASRGIAAWQLAAPASQEAALIQGADYLNGLMWRGHKLEARVMAWPRGGVVDADGLPVAENIVPAAVVAANIEVAALIVSGSNPLAPQERGGLLSSLTVGDISMSYAPDAPAETIYPVVRGLLRGLLRGGACVELSRG